MEELSELVKSRGISPSEGAGRHVLMIQDTSELNYNHLNGLLKVNDPDIGPISDNSSTGIFLHPCLAVDAENRQVYGISSIQVWNRSFTGLNKTERNYNKLPIENKESNKWLVAARESKEWLARGNRITLVGDRENDIYEYLCEVPDERTDILVRSSIDRKLSCGQLLSEKLVSEPWQWSFELDIAGSKKRTSRKAKMRVKWTTVQIARSAHKDQARYPEQVEVSVVEVLEEHQTVPKGEEAVHWRLLTTHPVTQLSQAMTIVEWYKQRWWVEDFFRILKQQGLEVERSQLSTGASLKKLVVMCLDQALKVLAMRQERLGQSKCSAAVCFEQEEIELLKVLHSEQHTGRKHNNPYEPESLAWATWIIAVLAGWTPTDLTKRPPGVITLSRGLKAFNQRYLGWATAMKLFQQKSKSSP